MAVVQMNDVEGKAVEELLHSHPPQPLQPCVSPAEDVLQHREGPLARRADAAQTTIAGLLLVGQQAVAEQREAIQPAPRVRDEQWSVASRFKQRVILHPGVP